MALKAAQPVGPLANAAPLDHPPDYAIQIAGVKIPVPKDKIANLRWRKELLTRAETDLVWRETLQAMVSEGTPEACLFWLNAFCDTYVQKQVDGRGVERAVTGERVHQPFITWPCQDRFVHAVFNAIRKGEDLAIDKSRDMGASWLLVAVFQYFFQFVEGSNFFELSRKEELVYNEGDMRALMQKHEYLLKRQPPWMVPKYRLTHMRLVNEDNGNTVIGDTTTGDAGHGGRVTAALIDEIARIHDARVIWEGLADTTATRIGNSTPHGPGFWSELVQSGKVRVLPLMFYEHPQKGQGRYEYVDEDTGQIRVSSAWRDARIKRAVTKREIAENIDADHEGAGRVIFPTRLISAHIKANACEPMYVGSLRYTGEAELEVSIKDHKARDWALFDNSAGALKLWCELFEDDRGFYRPAQNRTYVIGADVGQGVGASNSVASVFEMETRTFVAELATAEMSTDEFARMLCVLGYWFGGPRGAAFLAWEANGHGLGVGQRARRLGYPWLFRQVNEYGSKRTQSDNYGWFSSDDKKFDLLDEYKGELERFAIVNPSEIALQEARGYIHYDSGGCGPAALQEESSSARKTHGDRVIANALAVYASRYAFRTQPPERVPPKGSFEYRKRYAKWVRKKGAG